MPPPPALLRIALEVPDTEAEGPGRRYAVWVQGCPLRCPGCCNPDLLPFRGGRAVAPAELAARVVATPGIEGLTLLGGEPFAQAAPLAEVAEQVRAAGLSVMVFSGFTLEALRARADAARLLAATDLLVDGPYDARRPDTRRRWVGSTNQRTLALTDRYDPQSPRFFAPREVELRLVNGRLIVNGWPAPLGLP
ncbi:MAG: radical SAM protein [Myxococcales bacterium]|nr:radical SAM protein [Myxococcales bacterium]